MKFPTSIIIILLFLSPVLMTDYSGNNVSGINAVDQTVISESTGEDWLSGWTYRKSHVINSSAGAGPDYQVKLIVNYSSGVDAGDVVHCDNLCKPDFSDIRFTDDDGITELDYWMEESHDSDNATFWIEVADNLDTDQTVFMYFGNAIAISNSNGEDTFLFFDDFNDSSLDSAKWDWFGPWTESGGMASFSITSTGSAIDFPTLRTDNGWDMRNKSFASRWQFDENTVNRQWGMSCANDDGTMLSFFIGGSHVTPVSDIYFDLDHAGVYDHDVDAIDSWPIDTFFRTEFSSTPDGITKNEWRLDHESVSVYNGNSFTSGLQRIYLAFYVIDINQILNAGNLKMDFDWIYLRNQVSPEPAHGEWGSLESDTTDPTLSHPDDVMYVDGSQGNNITWTMYDLYPYRYQIHTNDDLNRTGNWNSTGESLSLSVDGFSVGIYNVSLTAIDASGNSAVDYVTVTIQPRFPVTIVIIAGGVIAIVIIGAVVCRMKKS